MLYSSLPPPPPPPLPLPLTLIDNHNKKIMYKAIKRLRWWSNSKWCGSSGRIISSGSVGSGSGVMMMMNRGVKRWRVWNSKVQVSVVVCVVCSVVCVCCIGNPRITEDRMFESYHFVMVRI